MAGNRLCLGLALLLASWAVNAAAVAIGSSNGVKVTLYDEPCELKAVKNMHMRAQWAEAGRTYEGCWHITPHKMVAMYFEDRTVVVIHVSAFKAATES